MKYKEHEITMENTNYSDGVAIINLPTGEIVCIPEENANDTEIKIIQQIKKDIKKRPKPEERKLTEEELKQRYDNLAVQYIREQYTQDDENKIMREYLSDMTNTNYKTAFDNYNTYVIKCKSKAHTEVYGGVTNEG